MLFDFEKKLADTIKPLYEKAIKVSIGPSFPPVSSANELLSICATELRLKHLNSNATLNDSYERSASYLQFNHEIPCDGTRQDIKIPVGKNESIAEIVVNGKIQTPGDDFSIEENVVKFYRAPEGQLSVYTIGERAQGYKEIYPANLTLEIYAWEKQAKDSDSILRTAISGVLQYLYQLDIIDMGKFEQSGAFYRLIKPLATVHSIERTAEKVGRAHFILSKAILDIETKLEIILASGKAEPLSIIKKIHYNPSIKKA